LKTGDISEHPIKYTRQW